MVKVEKNEILRLSMLIDPRFAYLEDFLPKDEWKSLESEFIDFLLKGFITFMFKNVIIEKFMGIRNLDKNKIPEDRNEINEASRNGNILESEFENDFLDVNENIFEADAYENVIDDKFEKDFLVRDENTMDIGKYFITMRIISLFFKMILVRSKKDKVTNNCFPKIY